MTMWPDSETTQHLLLQADGGDGQAVDALIERHRQALRRMIAARMDRGMAHRIDASDIVQETLIEAHRRLRDYLEDGSMPFHVWLRQIAKDRLIDAHRRHRAQRRDVGREQALAAAPRADQSSLDLAAQLCDMELTPAAQTLQHELEQRFWTALDTLEEPDREIILMRHQEQLGNAEAADLLQLSAAAAGMRYLRAIRRLRAALGESPSQNG
ncbi:MAG: sigma-70 family RNA polymerase sigma factor [Planctomycetaceae bacterium]|nr:sigma-70 family RNA polymerase sigma factor [Planctomycetaceae bacterium]